MNEQGRLENFTARYETGTIPWDDKMPPPELIAFAAKADSGRAIDLGCGYGRSSIYLAQNGWEVDGIDFVPQAIEIARERADKSGVSDSVRFHVGSVAELDFLTGSYDFAVDIGCMHSLPWPELLAYRDGLLRLLHDGGIYLLFAHLWDETDKDEEGIRWIKEAALLELFVEGFELEHAEYGVTQVEDKPPWQSVWFRFRRQANQAI